MSYGGYFFIIVIVTNVILDHLSELKILVDKYHHFNIVIPWMVSIEINGLMKNQDKKTANNAKAGCGWIYGYNKQKLPSNLILGK